MKIMHVCDWYRPIGGAEKLLFDSLAALEVQGHENIVLYNDHPDQLPSGKRLEYSIPGLEYHVYFQLGIRNLSVQSLELIDDIITKQKPDICHIRNFQNTDLLKFLISRLPCVRSVHDPRLYCFTHWKLLPDKSICRQPLGRACIDNGCLSKGLLPKTDYDRNAPHALRHFNAHKELPIIIAESRAQIDVLLANGFASDQIAWLPNFTPIPPLQEVETYIADHADSTEEPVILFVGRASWEKGAQVLIDACAHIKSNCKIVIITAGPMLEELVQRAAPFGGRVEIIPGLSYQETRVWYAKALCVVVPSVWLENFCLVGLEAFANMKPVIGSRIGGIPDWLVEGETGWLFDHGDAHALAGLIDRAVAAPETLAAMGKNGYSRVVEHYNRDLYLSRLLGIYNKAMGKFWGRNK
jgi:glycosyltransferase involved in cell wall biosynthesis